MLPLGVELSSEGINGCHTRNAKLFEWIILSVAIKRINVNKTKSDSYAFKSHRLRWISSDSAFESPTVEKVSRIPIPPSII